MSTDSPIYSCCNSPVHIGHLELCRNNPKFPRVITVKRVVLESPYRGDIDRNVLYARRAVRDSILRGESPSPMHLVHTQPGILRDEIPEERALGIKLHLLWIEVADAVVMYVDYGVSDGMKEAEDEANRLLKSVYYRRIGENP